jgi:hypothetical protein
MALSMTARAAFGERRHKETASQVHHLRLIRRSDRAKLRDLIGRYDFCHYLVHHPARANGDDELRLALDENQ